MKSIGSSQVHTIFGSRPQTTRDLAGLRRATVGVEASVAFCVEMMAQQTSIRAGFVRSTTRAGEDEGHVQVETGDNTIL